MGNTVVSYEKVKRLSKSFWYIRKNIKTEKKPSFKYLKYRILRPILKAYYKIFQLSQGKISWTSQASVIIFKKCLNKSMKGLEYGSGRSTIFFAERLRHLVSVEHNKEWYQFVKESIVNENINNLDYHYIPKNGQKISTAIPELYQKHKQLLEGHRPNFAYLDYFQFALSFPDNYFDFILVDGRARVECSLNCLEKLKPGGIFVLDNSEREHYAPVHNALSGWKKINTTTGLTDTTIWFKPNS